jgi:hypothetical protein
MLPKPSRLEDVPLMVNVAKFLIWSFFILVLDQTAVFVGPRYGLPVQPILVYAAISIGLLAIAVVVDRGISPLNDARLFFGSFAALVVLGLIMYRGEGPGPEFASRLLVPSSMPSKLGYAVWPAVNLVASVALYLLARHAEYRRTMVNAAFVALIVQAAAMETDMWSPAIFGATAGRAGGIAQNPNDAAFIVTALAALLLPAVSGEKPERLTVYAIMIAVAAVLFAQSRTGLLCAVLIVASLAIVAWKTPSLLKPHPGFVAGYVGVIAATLFFSPVLHVTEEQIAERNALHAELAKQNTTGSPDMPTADNLGDPNVDRGVVTLQERVRTRTSMDSSTSMRLAALSFYSEIVREHPFGLGTGFTNKFATGPHNMWLKMAVDEGIIGAVLFTVMLAAAWAVALKRRSFVLLCLSANASIAALLGHTVLVNPLFPTMLAVGMGMAQGRLPKSVANDAPRLPDRAISVSADHPRG